MFLLFAAALVLAALSVACSAAPDAPGTSSGTTTTTGNGGQGGNGGGGAGQGGDIINPGDEIVVVPSNPIVMLDLPLTQTVPFKCVDTVTDEPVAATWKLSSAALGTISSDGVFTPNGKQTGDVVVECETQNGTASTNLKVLFNIVEGDEALTQAEKDALLGPQGLEDASWKMVYPYPDTVFPRGILPPEIHMSTGSSPGDTYYVHILVPSFEYKGFFKAPATATQLAMSQVAWDALTQVAGGQKVVVEVAKLSGGTKYGPITRKWVLAKGKLHGVIHYESYDTQLAGNPGAILRIKGNSPMPEVLLDNCTVCHSVAADGSTIATASGTFDLTGGNVNPPNLWNGDSSFAALFPKNGSVIVTSYFNTPQLRTKAGETITGSGIEANTVESASFSLDGTRFAFWNSPLGAQNSVLGMLDYDEVAQKFTNFQVLANMTNVPVTTWPAFMPDGKTVVFQVGTTNMTAGGTGRLMAVDVATKQLTNLASLNGDGYLPGGPARSGQELRADDRAHRVGRLLLGHLHVAPHVRQQAHRPGGGDEAPLDRRVRHQLHPRRGRLSPRVLPRGPGAERRQQPRFLVARRVQGERRRLPDSGRVLRRRLQRGGPRLRRARVRGAAGLLQRVRHLRDGRRLLREPVARLHRRQVLAEGPELTSPGPRGAARAASPPASLRDTVVLRPRRTGYSARSS
jgi:hypothetical protein